MQNLHARPHGANAPDPTHPPLDFRDPTAVRAWIVFLREHALDAIALGEDATKPPSARTFSRHEARRRLVEEERVILALLDAGERSLPPVPDAPPRS